MWNPLRCLYGRNMQSVPSELRHAALHWLAEPEHDTKSAGVIALAEANHEGAISLDTATIFKAAQAVPGRPSLPELVSHQLVPRRSMHTVTGRAALIHALAHIEFNAINLALDAIWRFPAMPDEYYFDWLGVAAEETRHFNLLSAHLARNGYAYGDFPAHNGLWEMAEKTRDDILARIALVPRTLEARGLDATPAVRAKLAQAGEMAAAEILDVILADEIGHVLVGNRWYNWLCAQRGLEPVATYELLADQYQAPALRGPFNLEARRAAGFSETELAGLTAKK